MSIRKTVLFVATSICIALPFQAQAGDLIVNNRTDFDSTSATNGAICSKILGNEGVSRAHTEHNVIPERKVKMACTILHKHDCRADVYMSANCTGRKVASVVFDVDKGHISTTLFPAEIPKEGDNKNDPRFINFNIITVSPFETTIEQTN